MRIHFGVSKFIRPSSLIKVLGALFVGLLAFFGITQHQIVYAEGWQSLTFGTSDYSVAYTSSDGYSAGSSGVFLSGGPPDYLLGSNYLDVASTGVTINQAKFSHYGSSLCSAQDDYLEMIFDFHVFDTSNNHVSYDFKLDTYGSQASCSYTRKTDSIVTVTCSKNIADISDSTFRILFTAISFSDTTYQEAHVGPYKIINYQCSNSTGAIINNNNTNTNNIINNQNQNTQDIIDSNAQNTQDIIDNQNANNQALIDSNKVCSQKTLGSSSYVNSGFLNNSGTHVSSSSYHYTDYIELDGLTINYRYPNTDNPASCFYDENKVLLSCIPVNYSAGSYTLPSGTKFARFSQNIDAELPVYTIHTCVNGSQAISDDLTDDDISGASSEIVNVFGVSVQDHGLTSVAIAPIRLLSNLLDSNSSCSDLSFDITLGSLTKNVTLPSGCILWGSAPSSVIAIYQTVIYGLLGFYVLLDMYKFLSNLLDPENKEIYFLDL